MLFQRCVAARLMDWLSCPGGVQLLEIEGKCYERSPCNLVEFVGWFPVGHTKTLKQH